MSSVREAWFLAAQDLRIRIQEPNPLEGVPDDPDRVIYLPDFGDERGTVVFAQDFGAAELKEFQTDVLDAAGYYFSILSLDGYARYDRGLFLETLVDWGYFGPDDQVPAWLSGEKVDR